MTKRGEIISIPMTGGLDTEHDPNIIVPGTFSDLDNIEPHPDGLRKATGAVSFTKDAIDKNGSSVTLGTIDFVTTDGDTPICISDGQLYEYSEASSKWLWRARWNDAQVSVTPVSDLVQDLTSGGVVRDSGAGDIACYYTQKNGDNSRYYAVDTVSRTIISSLTSGKSDPQGVYSGGSFRVFSFDRTNNKIQSDSHSGIPGASWVTVTDWALAEAVTAYDGTNCSGAVHYEPDTGKAVIAYPGIAPLSLIIVGIDSSGGAIGAGTGFLPAVGTIKGVCIDIRRVVVGEDIAYGIVWGSTGYKPFVYNVAVDSIVFGNLVAATDVIAASLIWRESDLNVACWITRLSSRYETEVKTFDPAVGGIPFTAVKTIYHTHVYGKPWSNSKGDGNSFVHFYVAYNCIDSAEHLDYPFHSYSTGLGIVANDGLFEGQLYQYIAESHQNKTSSRRSDHLVDCFYKPSANKAEFCLTGMESPEFRRVEHPGSRTHREIHDRRADTFMGRAYHCEYEHNEIPFGDRYNRVVYLTGWGIKRYDGNLLTNLGFLAPPMIVNSLGIVTVTEPNDLGMAQNDTYSYRMFLRHYDKEGNEDVSGPQQLVFKNFTVTTFDAFTTDVAAPLHQLLQNTGGKAVIEIYRTEKNPTGIFAPHHLEKRIEIDDSSTFITYQSGLDDEIVRENARDYVSNLELDRVMPPACRKIIFHRDRMYVAGGEVRATLASTLTMGNGLLAPQFNEALQIYSDTPSEGVGAMARQSNALIVFGDKKTIYSLSGDGPSDLGQGSFNRLNKLNTGDLGALSSQVAETSQGVIFHSTRGWYHLSLGFTVSEIGEPVRDTYGMTVKGVVLRKDDDEVVYFLGDGTQGNETLSYYVNRKLWVRQSRIAALQAVTIDGEILYVDPSGDLLKTSEGVYEINGSPYSMVLTTPAIHGGAHNLETRFIRSMLEGSYISDSDFEIKFYYDGDEEPIATALPIIWDSSNTLVNQSYAQRQLCRHALDLIRQRASKIKMRLIEIPGSTGEGVRIISWELLVRRKQKANTPPNRHRRS